MQVQRFAASQAAVVTIGALQAGTKDNVIPDDALLKLNVRTFDEQVRARVLDAITRIVEAEATASSAPRPPEITMTEHYSVFWYVGGTDADLYRTAEEAGRVAQDIPTNHNAAFAPVIHPTLETGVQAITTGALDALGIRQG